MVRIIDPKGPATESSNSSVDLLLKRRTGLKVDLLRKRRRGLTGRL